MKSIDELKAVREVLRLEKEEEAEQYRKLLLETPLEERVKKGATWYPLALSETGWSLGEHPYILVERTKQINKPHKFRAGQVVNVFSNQVSTAGAGQKGVVHFVDKNRMKVIFYGTQLPDWISKGKLGIDLDFDERSYQEMDAALQRVMEAQDDRLAELREILLGHKAARFDTEAHPFFLPYLNDAQNAAVQQILTARDVAVVHGPPGTGKTTTLVFAIEQLAKKEKNILVCAPSNPAADLLTERLATQGLHVVRIGNISRVDEHLLPHTVEGYLEQREEMQEVKRMKIEAAQYFQRAGKFKRNFGPRERAQRREDYREGKMLMRQAKMLEDYTIERILSEADAIVCTLVSAMNRYIESRQFKTVIIDEAAQALEPSAWIPITKAQRVVFAGDPFQLPPTVKSAEAAKGGLTVTLLEKVIERLPDIQLLNVQYRMHEVIMNFSNAQFYDNKLQAADFVAAQRLAMNAQGDDSPLEFIDTAGCSFDEKINAETLSRYNEDEYFVLRQHLDALLTYTTETQPSIGIISPYREQVRFIRSHIESDFDHYPTADLTVDTIDAFQGQERDVIYISLVRSNSDSEIGFLRDTRRMNVAMTRAKRKLIIIGDSATLGAHGFYNDFLNYCERHGAYKTAWEFQ